MLAHLKILPGLTGQRMRSLSWRIRWLIVLTILPAVVLALYQARYTREMEIETIQAQTLATIRGLAMDQQHMIDDTRSFLKTLAGMPLSKHPEDPACSDRLADILALNHLYFNLGLPKPDGELLCNALPLKKRVNVHDRPYFQRALNSRDFSIGSFQRDRAAQVTSVNLAYPVIQPDTRKVVSVAVAVISLDWWSRQLANSGLPEGTVVRVVDSGGKVVARFPEQASEIGNPVADPALANLSGEGFLRRLDSGGSPILVAFYPLLQDRGAVAATMVVSVPLERIYAAANHQAWGFMAFLLAGLFVSALLVSLGVKRLVTSPLESLLAATDRLANGVVTKEIKASEASELAELATRFQTMATRRQLAETNLREGAEQLRLALEAAKAGTWLWDLQTQQNTWSDETYRLYGLKPGSCKPSYQTWLNAVHPDCRAQAQEMASQAISRREELNFEWRVNLPEGHIRWLFSRGRPEQDEGGHVVRYIGIVMDISERKQSELELEQHRHHLQQLVDRRTADLAKANSELAARSEEISDLYNNAPCGYHSLSPEGTILSVNDTELKLLGYTRSEFVGRSITDFMTPEGRESFHQYFSALKETGSIRDVEVEYLKKDGTVLSALVGADMVRNAQGWFDHTRSILVDNSERKAREAELHRMQEALTQRASEAEAATRAKSSFLANMSHEIRTPLNAIIGLTHLVLGAGQPPDQADRLKKIENSGHHLLSIINDILDISKIEAGRIELEHEDFHLSAILDNIQSMIGDQARSKGLRVETDRDSVPVWLRGDATRLRQALLNYAGNAVKFTEQGTISLRAFLLEDHGHDLLVRFEVQDTGIGIPADVLPGLFRAFEQADVSTTRKYGGTGLGLAITRRLAGLMGGEAGATSTPGEGSLFWLTARLERGHGATPGITPASSENATLLLRQRYRGVRVLLAEDNEINREVAMELLHSVGFDVDTAANGNEAVAMARRTDYALILMDMQMPEKDGLEATRAIRLLPGWENRPIIAMTANVFDEDRRRCEEAGMNDFVVKPVNTEHFFETLLKWLDAGKAARPASRPDATDPPGSAQPSAGALDGRGDLPGINTTLGLRYIGGNAARYREVLHKFQKQYGAEFISEFRTLRKGQDLDTTIRTVHSVKSAARSIGATRLGDIAERLETALKESDHAAVLREETMLEDELARVTGSLLRIAQEPFLI